MEANIEGIWGEQQTIQSDFHQFGSEVIKGFAAVPNPGSLAMGI